jgi:hypothetical protein
MVLGDGDFALRHMRFDERGWRATFYTTGMEHSPTSATGTGRERMRADTDELSSLAS